MNTPDMRRAALQEQARSLAEDWHEGLPEKGGHHDWCCRAAGVLLALSEPQAAQMREALEWARNTLADHGQQDNDNWPTMQKVCAALAT
jgi:hypothetical protein